MRLKGNEDVSNPTIALAVVCGVLGLVVVVLIIVIFKKRNRQMARIHTIPEDGCNNDEDSNELK